MKTRIYAAPAVKGLSCGETQLQVSEILNAYLSALRVKCYVNGCVAMLYVCMF